MSVRLADVVAFVALATVACSTSSDAPVDPVWGKDPCAHCGMIVGDRRAAAEAVDEKGDRLFFDDVGCMVSFVAERHLTLKKSWVRAPDREVWIDAEAARFAGGHTTPMDYGFTPTSAPSGLSWAELQERVLARQKESSK